MKKAPINNTWEKFYTPASLDEVLGNSFALSYIKKFAMDIKAGLRRKPLLLFGPPGTGKTLSAHLIAKEMRWNVVEMNASNYRDAESINRIAVTAASSRHLFGGKNLVLFDEIDELMPKFDSGASRAIEKLISKSFSPIIFIADDPWKLSIKFLRNRTDKVEFKKLNDKTIQKIIMRFAKKAGFEISNEMVKLIAAKAGGDARSAINDAWALAGAEEQDTEVIGTRNKKEEIFGVLDKIFRSYSFSAPLIAVAHADEEHGMLINWIDENISRKYTYNNEISKALENLSLATTYLSRASRSQYYKYWRYTNVLMSSGIALSKEHSPSLLTRYSYPRVIRILSKSKEERRMKKKIAKKLSRYLHSSTKRIIAQDLPLISQEVKKELDNGKSEDEIIEFFVSKFGLTPKEAEYIISLG